jgi:sRNA-binding carbon storage regulator CsrA
MLILTRFPGEEVEMIAEQPATIRVTVLGFGANGVVRLGFTGPKHVTFMRDNAKTRHDQPKEQGDEESVIERERQGRRVAFQDIEADDDNGNR